jgi:hypothetical protein
LQGSMTVSGGAELADRLMERERAEESNAGSATERAYTRRSGTAVSDAASVMGKPSYNAFQSELYVPPIVISPMNPKRIVSDPAVAGYRGASNYLEEAYRFGSPVMPGAPIGEQYNSLMVKPEGVPELNLLGNVGTKITEAVSPFDIRELPSRDKTYVTEGIRV